MGQVHARPVDRARARSTTTGAASPSSTASSAASSRTRPRRCSRSTPVRSTITYLTADEVERERATRTRIVLPGDSGVDNDIVLNPLKHPEFANKRRPPGAAVRDRPPVDRRQTSMAAPANIVPCLYGLTEPDRRRRRRQPYDPAKAKALLTEAGVDLAALGELDFDTYYSDPLSANVDDRDPDELADNLGINGQDHSSSRRGMDRSLYDDGNSTCRCRWRGERPDRRPRLRLLPLVGSAYPPGGNGSKGYHYKNPEVDKLLEDGRGPSSTRPSRTRIYQQVCQITRGRPAATCTCGRPSATTSSATRSRTSS